MAYIGKAPVNGLFAIQSITTDGSTTTFALDFTIGSTTAILVLVGGVVQEPDTAYTLSGGGTSIVFSTAPTSSQTAYIHFLGQAVVQNLTDLNGVQLILDADADTSITADTDDQIDFKLGGSDVIAFKTTGIHLPDGEKYVAGTGDDLQLYHDGTNSYIANAVGALKVATETSGIAVTIGHTTSEVTFGDNVTVTGNLTIGGTTNFGDFNITNVGSIALDTITNDGTDITLDSSGDIILDAAGNDIFFKAGGTTIGEIENESNTLVIKSAVSDGDLKLKGNDGGSEITALTLDMSAAGAATFNSTVTATGLVIGSASVTEAQLEILDGATITTTELNLIDGGTSRGTTALASGDGILINDAGTMRMTNVDTVKTFMQTGLTSNSILDADSDTKIQVEEGTDEDIIRYDVAGAEVATQTARGFEFTAVGGFVMNQTTNSQTFTIASTENAIVAGPIALSGTITVEGSLAVV